MTGTSAWLLGAAILAVYSNGEPAELFQKRLSVGINSTNWRSSAIDSCTMVCGNSGGKIFFAIVFDLPQLQQLQRLCFPHEQWRVATFNSVARLPSAADEQAFVLYC